MRIAGAPASARRRSSRSAARGATAASMPPFVCASASTSRSASSIEDGRSVRGKTNSRFAAVPPGISPRRARSRTSGRMRSASARIVARALLARSIESRWPSRPKPVTSVSACTSFHDRASTSPAARFSVFICATAARISSGEASSFLMAETAMPVPSALVSSTTSPGRAPSFLKMRRGSTTPVTARPYFGSTSSTLCPPTIGQPASCAFSAPPARISPSISQGWPRGKPTRLSA